MDLSGRRALVTGASRGIGLAAAAALADAGAQVTLLARGLDELERAATAVRQAGGSAETLQLDVTDLGSVRQALSQRGPYDILFNNAGTNRPKPFLEATEEDFDLIMTLNVKAAFFMAQLVAGGLVAADRPGSIINVCSQMGHVGGPNRGIYCASKWAVEGMTKSMAIDLAKHGVRVNTICPTFIETPLALTFFSDSSFKADVLSRIKLGRLGKVTDLMGAIVFLASDASSLMTGSSMLIDGGWTAD
jgi:NAD(P)-dependent dehydrogenase (short-subunit alcohol dehydrogenase family)